MCMDHYRRIGGGGGGGGQGGHCAPPQKKWEIRAKAMGKGNSGNKQCY